MVVLEPTRRSVGVPWHAEATAIHIDGFTFGSIRIDGVRYEHDVVITHGRVHKRKKKP